MATRTRTASQRSIVPVFDVTRQYRQLKPRIDRLMQEVCDSGAFILGPHMARFEQEFAKYHGVAHAVGVASGTDALELALRAAGVGEGDEVITTPFTFIATTEAICAVGATPVFADIDPQTYCIDPAEIEAKITKRTKALLPVHLYGQPAEMAAIGAIARKHRLLVVEDCAQATGARYGKQLVGTFGIAGCFSFYPTKNLGAYGDGGMIITQDAAIATQLRKLRTHGGADKFHHDVQGRNSRLDELQSVVLRVKLPHLNRWNAARRKWARLYTKLFAAAGEAAIGLPSEADGTTHVFHLYVVRLPQRERVRQLLGAQGITTGTHYPIALHLERVYQPLGYQQGSLPVAEEAATETVTLPLFPELTEAEVRRVARGVVDACRAVAGSTSCCACR